MGSKKSEVPTKIEEEDKTSLIDGLSIASDKKPKKIAIETSDDSLNYLREFDLDEAWNILATMPGCYKVALSEFEQKDLGVRIGVNVTSEFPWKQIKYKIVRDYLPEEEPPPHETGEEADEKEEIVEKFAGAKPDDLILIGYAPTLSEEEDIFLVYTTNESAKKAAEIIRGIETYQRWLLNQKVIKKGGRWTSMGSEAEVELGLPVERKTVIDVEVQSVYPIKHSELMFKHRFSSDVRDGYVELVPGDRKYENVFRRRINAGVQCAPARVHLEQQTDPTFPSNAWSQYLYEINADDEGLDQSEDDEDEETSKKKLQTKSSSSRPGSPAQAKTPEPESEPPPPRPPPEMSDQVKNLLQTLEFNQVDMYRNDYPLISDREIPKYSIPVFKEILCFANISRSINRYVCGVSWYPTLSGLLTASYTFTTVSTTETGESNVDIVKRAVIEPNPVLMWSFDDSLHHMLEFEAPREVTCISFCPYDENILIGGTINGLIIIWDLQNRIAKAEVEEVLTAAQLRYRNIVREYLSWTQPASDRPIVRPAAVSALSYAQGGPITNIKWLAKSHYITVTGQARESEEANNRFFVSCSLGGTIAFWNLDADVDKKRIISASNRNIPKQLLQDVSMYKKFDRIFKPQYIIEHKHPLTSILFNRARFEYVSKDVTEHRGQMGRFSLAVVIEVKPVEYGRQFQQDMIVSTMVGGVQKFVWEGFDFVQSTEVNKEVVLSTEDFVHVHDGPVSEVRRNPFCDEIFASIGRNVLAIWKEGCFQTAIFWRKRPASLTRMEWSLDRPSILFLCRSDGTVEVWDLLARTDDAALADVLGGSIITALSEHCPVSTQKVIGIGDYNSSFRILVLPPIFRSKVPMEAERLSVLVNREETRKLKILTWEKEWLERNADLLEARRAVEEQAQQELERIKKEAQLLEELRLKREAEESRKAQLKEKKKLVFDLPERLEKKWDDMNLRRLVKVLMSRRLVDREKLSQQTALEKSRLKYEKSKKIAIKRSFKTIDADVAAVRARLLPVVVEKKERIEIVAESAQSIVDEARDYKEIELASDKHIETFPVSAKVAFREFLEHGRQRRCVLNKSLGGTTARRDLYRSLKESASLADFNFKYDVFASTEAVTKGPALELHPAGELGAMTEVSEDE